MKTWSLLFAGLIPFTLGAQSREPLAYATIPPGTYVPPVDASKTTLLNLIQSKPELSTLVEHINSSAGFMQAFDTLPQWNYTFFAPNNDAFEAAGSYFSTYYNTPKGKFWFGNILTHHYIPSTILKVGNFQPTATRVQTGSYLYIETQVVDGNLTLNKVATVVEADIAVTNGVVHIIDQILDPSYFIFESDGVAKQSQQFIAGSCSNPNLPYC